MSTPALKEIPFSLEIDEEGYPVFSGLRVHDEEVLADIFAHLVRSQHDLKRSKLVTCLEGKNWAWIDAFDAPLVAQSAALESESQVSLSFLGGRSETVALTDFEIDEWNRLHAVVGEDLIPAVLSRKAQASLLNAFVNRGLSPELGAFRQAPSQALSKEEFWTQVYVDKQDGWELGSAHPELFRRDFKAFRHARILVPGAGRGHDAAFLATTLESSRVLALDFSEEAERAAKQKYSEIKNLSFERCDVFGFLKSQKDASWDFVFEHTFFCAIDPLRRLEYVKEIARVLKPGGVWAGVFFLLEHSGGPPFALTQWELREFTRGCFDVFEWERIAESPAGRTHKELWASFSKRSI